MATPLRPKLRPLEITPFTSRGEQMLWMHDRLGIAPDAQLPVALAPLLSLFDGTRTVAQIVTSYALKGGETLPHWFVEKIIGELDEQFFLESPRFAARCQKVRGEFAASHSRPAAHAGQSYPAEPTALRHRLGSFFKEASQLGAMPLACDPAKLRGIVVPHIDFTRGGAVEALAYHELLRGHFDVFVILGIAHCGVRYPFCAAAKDYETPLGSARADMDFVRALERRIGERLLAEQFAHKNEHSIEFVAVFLQYLEQFKAARIVPILCGGFHDEVQHQTSPAQNADVAQFCLALRDTVHEVEKAGQRVGFIASVDLAHVGPNFGDREPVTPAHLRAIEKADREFLACVELGGAEAMHAHFARDNNARNVDAHPALYTLLLAFPELRAQLLHYTHADAPSKSIVSFASMVLYDS